MKDFNKMFYKNILTKEKFIKNYEYSRYSYLIDVMMI